MRMPPRAKGAPLPRTAESALDRVGYDDRLLNFMKSDQEENYEAELRRCFLENGKSFFAWNSGTNTGNVLISLTKRIESLEQSIRDSGESSGRLANALNKITFWYAVITAIGVACTVLQVVLVFVARK